MRYLWPEHMCITAGPGGREETAQVSTSARLTLPCLGVHATLGDRGQVPGLGATHPDTCTHSGDACAFQS